MRKRWAALLAAVIMLAPVAGAQANPFEHLQWQKRLLVIDHAESDQAREQLREVYPGSDILEFLDRDMALVEIAPDRVSIDGAVWRQGKPAVRAVRNQIPGLDAGFTVLLIGLDGGIKARFREPVALDRIYTQIDRMPIRQQELRRRAEQAQ